MLSRRTAITTMFITFVCCAALRSYAVFSFGIVNYGTPMDFCETYRHSDYSAIDFYLIYVHPWFGYVISALIPGLLIVIFNIIIIVNLHRTRQRRRRLTNNSHSSGETMNPVILMLLAVSTTFLLLETPGVVIGIKTAMDGYFTEDGAGFGTPNELLIRSLFRIIYFLTSLNHSINFVLYFVSTRDFRTELVKILREISSCGKQSSSHSASFSSVRRTNNHFDRSNETQSTNCSSKTLNVSGHI